MRFWIAGSCIVSLMVGNVVAAEGSAEDASKAELARLQGKWKITALEINGQAVEDSPVTEVIVTIKDHELTKSDDADTKFKITLIDPTTKPKVLDVFSSKNDQTLEGIYELDGDTWRLCINLNALEVRERPTEFSSQNGLLIVSFKREAP